MRWNPFYEAISIVHEKSFEKFPGLEDVLRGLLGTISEEEVRKMNYALENKKEKVYDVAHVF